MPPLQTEIQMIFDIEKNFINFSSRYPMYPSRLQMLATKDDAELLLLLNAGITRVLCCAFFLQELLPSVFRRLSKPLTLTGEMDKLDFLYFTWLSSSPLPLTETGFLL